MVPVQKWAYIPFEFEFGLGFKSVLLKTGLIFLNKFCYLSQANAQGFFVINIYNQMKIKQYF